MKWIDTGDLNNWANGKQRHCAQTLPELIRRLILATGDVPPEEIDFASGDSIATGGWDGRLKTSAASSFFPSGASGWEIGVEKSPGKKAEKDYLKRVADPLGLTAKEMVGRGTHSCAVAGTTEIVVLKLNDNVPFRTF